MHARLGVLWHTRRRTDVRAAAALVRPDPPAVFSDDPGKRHDATVAASTLNSFSDLCRGGYICAAETPPVPWLMAGLQRA